MLETRKRHAGITRIRSKKMRLNALETIIKALKIELPCRPEDVFWFSLFCSVIMLNMSTSTERIDR